MVWYWRSDVAARQTLFTPAAPTLLSYRNHESQADFNVSASDFRHLRPPIFDFSSAPVPRHVAGSSSAPGPPAGQFVVSVNVRLSEGPSRPGATRTRLGKEPRKPAGSREGAPPPHRVGHPFV